MPRTSPTGNRRGFTLLEMLVAITIAAIVMTIAGTAFTMTVNTSRRLEDHSDRHQNLRQLTTALEMDLRNARPAGPGAAAGQVAWEGKRLSFPGLDDKGQPGTVSYELKGSAIRRSWTPEGKDAQPVVTDAGRGIADWEIAYEAEGGAVQALGSEDWPRAVTIGVRFAEDKGKPGPLFRRRVRLEAEPPPRAKGP